MADISIYASLPAPDDDHAESCSVWVEGGSGVFAFVDHETCSCGLRHAPLVYRGSHFLPSADDRRGGDVSLALIPGHITRDGRDDAPDDETPWPYLRVGVNEGTVVLDRRGVERVYLTLSAWLDLTEENT